MGEMVRKKSNNQDDGVSPDGEGIGMILGDFECTYDYQVRVQSS